MILNEAAEDYEMLLNEAAEDSGMLLNAERTRLLDGNRQFLKEFLKRRVRRQIQTVEARVSSVTLQQRHDQPLN